MLELISHVGGHECVRAACCALWLCPWLIPRVQLWAPGGAGHSKHLPLTHGLSQLSLSCWPPCVMSLSFSLSLSLTHSLTCSLTHSLTYSAHRCEQLLQLMSHVGGLSVQDVSDHSISLCIDICVPSSRHQHTNSE